MSPAHRPTIALPALMAALLLAAPAWGQPLHDALEAMLDGHQRLAAARADERAAEAAAARARGGYYPDLKFTGSYGRANENRPMPTEGSDLNAQQVDLSLTQPLWDFGKTDAEVDKADLAREQAATLAQSTRQDLMLEGLAAYINLHRARRSLTYARQSVDNIRRQTGLEESRVEVGAGMPTDVLQAKSQLAGAQARLSRAEGAMVAATNRYRTVFGDQPPEAAALQPVTVPFDRLPATLDDARVMARENNFQLRAMRLSEEIARAEVRRIAGADLAPKINAVALARAKKDTDNIRGVQQEQVIKVEMTYPFNLGLAPIHAHDAAREAALAAESRVTDTSSVVEELVRNAWQSLATARDNLGHLENQARISAEFLRLAREERLHGRRSLIDVLAGETNLINAQSDAASAEADVGIAAFTLLKAAGALDLDDIR